MPGEFGVMVRHRRENGVAGSRVVELFLPGGTHFMVMKNQLPAATHCGIVCGNFLRAGKSVYQAK